MKQFAIMREAGPQAKRRAGSFGYARPKRVGTVQGEGPVDALQQYVYQKYLRQGNRQFVTYWIEYRYRGRWLSLNGASFTEFQERRREWRLIISLRNGRNRHYAKFYAWQQEGR